MRFLGVPGVPNPGTMIVDPSGTSATAASKLGKTLFFISPVPQTSKFLPAGYPF
ncbi:MAG: hypothetical protein OXI90_13085 [Gammaproteobacteria bacterium]|nr:hypothetical protein [Gammaproteobacteria bacterium]